MYENDITLEPDEQLFILRLPSGLRSTYITWRIGHTVKYLMPRETYYRHKRIFMEKYNIDLNKTSVGFKPPARGY